MYTIAATPLNHPDLTALIAELDAYQQTLYPAESNHLIDLSALPAESVIALIIRDTRQQAVGCGAIVLGEEGFGEMKRVFINPAHRGQQLGEKLLAALEKEAINRECIPCAWKPASISTPPLRYIRAMGIRPAAPSRRISRIR
ncbi:N-acetyltransferase GCN5 [Klebsiella grimontii]|uniref:N-acetyltransferase GCN5 n=1 Tax=Klebsiella grimontii TaxID=2058152 RepID=A0A7H4P397_9ENTR|nr:N-acetyltransferase GCN5 [Klebsiella grimontii]